MVGHMTIYWPLTTEIAIIEKRPLLQFKLILRAMVKLKSALQVQHIQLSLRIETGKAHAATLIGPTPRVLPLETRLKLQHH